MKQTLLHLFFIIILPLAVKAQSPKIKAEEAMQYVGKTVTVTDSIYSTKTLDSVTLLNMGGHYPNQLLTLVILKADLRKFIIDPAKILNNRNLTVTGKIVEYQGKPQMMLSTLQQVKINNVKPANLNDFPDYGSQIYIEAPNLGMAAVPEDNANVDFIPPSFPGGTEAFEKYIEKNMIYPKAAIETGTYGRIVVDFIVEKDGSLSDLKISRGLTEECNAEALRLLKTGPKFIPGKRKGEVVRSPLKMLVRFRLPK